MQNTRPVVIVSSYPPRPCGIATFTEEAREFIQKSNPGREVLVISHTDGEGRGVYPIIDLTKADWWRPVAEKINELKPYAVHLQHEYGLYNHIDDRGHSDRNRGFLSLLESIRNWPVVVEPHTVHGRLRDEEADFVYQLSERIDVLILKCHYQKWRLDWTFSGYGWKTLDNIMVIPHGVRADRQYLSEDMQNFKKELGLDERLKKCERIVGLIGWIQSNKRWDILTSIWKEIHDEVYKETGERWTLLAAGAMRDPNHKSDYEKYKEQVKQLEQEGIACYHEFVPRGDDYYKVMALCDFIVLPSTDETQSGTLARIIALNKPYITTAPMEGLTSQTLESEGGLLFTTKKMLKEKVIKLACDQQLRCRLGENLKDYLENTVSWDIVAGQYNEAYKLANMAKQTGERVSLPKEF